MKEIDFNECVKRENVHFPCSFPARTFPWTSYSRIDWPGQNIRFHCCLTKTCSSLWHMCVDEKCLNCFHHTLGAWTFWQEENKAALIACRIRNCVLLKLYCSNICCGKGCRANDQSSADFLVDEFNSDCLVKSARQRLNHGRIRANYGQSIRASLPASTWCW